MFLHTKKNLKIQKLEELFIKITILKPIIIIIAMIIKIIIKQIF